MDRGKYLTTGELAKLMHVTKNTLFHYDKIGLFSPELVLENEYRYYSIHQLEALDTIIVLKELGMPLKEIRGFLNGRSPEKLLELFDREERQIRNKLRKLKDQSRFIQEKSEQIRSFQRKETDRVYTVPFKERYYLISTYENPDNTVVAEKITELSEAYESRNHSMRYEIGYIQHGEDIASGQYGNYRNVVLLMRKKPNGLSYQSFPEGDYLTIYYRGDWHNIGCDYEKLLAYAKEHRLKLSDKFLETSVVDSLMAEREEDYVTEITVQILEAEKTLPLAGADGV